MIKNIFYILIFGLLILVSCDTVEEPYVEPGQTVWNGRKIILFDFTGHKCVNCPAAHEKVNQLQESFGEAIVPIAVHCTYFSNTDSHDFKYDFTCPEGIELGGDETGPGYFDFITLPKGAVNTFVAEEVSAPGQWASLVQPFLADYPEFSIDINNSYNSTDSIISSDISVTTVITNPRNISLCVYVLESGIVKPQADANAEVSPVQDYVHNHVLRGSMSGTWGESINGSSEENTESDTYSESYELKINNDWKPENISIVAFIYDFDSKEILQAEENELIH